MRLTTFSGRFNRAAKARCVRFAAARIVRIVVAILSCPAVYRDLRTSEESHGLPLDHKMWSVYPRVEIGAGTAWNFHTIMSGASSISAPSIDVTVSHLDSASAERRVISAKAARERAVEQLKSADWVVRYQRVRLWA